MVARCAAVNHFATTIDAFGNAPASPAPNANRTASSGRKPLTAPVNAVNIDHHATTRASTRRAPMRSPITPVGISKIA